VKRATPPDVGSGWATYKGRFVRAVFMKTSQKAGYRFDRRPDMDLWEEPEPEVRDEALREAVDDLPEDERLVVSRLFFGADNPSLQLLSRELGISIDKVKARRDRGLDAIRHLLGAQ
jgi:DNA-directed RNA polymerase specialized sigma24 family protein